VILKTSIYRKRLNIRSPVNPQKSGEESDTIVESTPFVLHHHLIIPKITSKFLLLINRFIARSIQSVASKDKKLSTSNRGSGGIRTLADLNRRPAPDSDSDSDNPQEYYTGGDNRLSFGWVVFLVMIYPLITAAEKMRYDSF
ncbi:Plant UBX domain-containing protein, partial [Drosera capensis]